MVGLCLNLISNFTNLIQNAFNDFRRKYFKRTITAVFASFMLTSHANAVTDTLDCNYVYGIKNVPSASSTVFKFDDISTVGSTTSTGVVFGNNANIDNYSTIAIGYAPGSSGITNELRIYRWRYRDWVMNENSSLARPSYYISGGDDTRRYVTYAASNLLQKESAGGEVNQLTGEIYLSSNWNDNIAIGTFSISVINPFTGASRYVTFTKDDPSEPDLGQTVSDMIIDAEGNTFVISRGSDNNNYLARLNMTTGKYNIVTKIKNGFTGDSDVHAGGMAFLNGYIYVYNAGAVYKIDPVSGNASMVSNSNLNEFTDLASCQLVPLITGKVYNDANGDGVLDESEKINGAAGVRVELYDAGFKLLGTQTTKDSGSYNFIINNVNSVSYYIRVVNPVIDGKRATQTWASGGSFSDPFQSANIVMNHCTDFLNDDNTGGDQSRTCYGARADGADSAAGDMGNANYYSEILMKTDKAVAHADFAFTAVADRSDAPLAYGEVVRNLGVKDAFGEYIAYLGNGVSTDNISKVNNNASGDDFDDGVFVVINGVETPLQNVVLLRGQTYTFKTYLNGSMKDKACVKSFIGLDTSGNFLSNSFQNLTGCISQQTGNLTEFTYKIPLTTNKLTGDTFLRTIFTFLPTGTSFDIDYKGDISSSATAAPWVLNGEVEDYRVVVAGRQIRFNVKSIDDIGNFTFNISNIEEQLPSVSTRTMQTITPNVFVEQPYDGIVHAISDVSKDIKISGIQVPSKFELVTSQTKCVDSSSNNLSITFDVDGNITLPSSAIKDDSNIVCSIVYATAPTVEFVANITNRIHDDDNFNITIKHANNSNAVIGSAKTLSGAVNASTGVIQVVSGNKYIFDEIMADGNMSVFNHYSKNISCINLKDNTTISTSNLVPFDITPALGDKIKCEITNDALIANLQTSSIVAEPQSQKAGNRSTITVTLKDDLGSVINAGGDDVVIFINATTAMTLANSTDSQTSAVANITAVDNNNGTYVAYIDSTAIGLANVTFTVNGNFGLNNATVEFTHSDNIDINGTGGTTIITANPISVQAGGYSNITVTIGDEFNNPVSNATVNIIVLEGTGSITPVTNNNDGTYSAQLNSSTKGNVTVGFTANGAQSALNATVEFTTNSYSLANSTISADFINLSINENSTIRVTLFDTFGNLIDVGGEDVVILIAGSTVTNGNALLHNGTTSNTVSINAFDHSNGTYSARLTSSSEGVVTVGFSINGTVSQKTISIEFRGGNVTLVAILNSSVKKAKVGDLIKYTATIENIGTITAKNFTMANIVPFGFSYVDKSAYVSSNSSFDLSWDKTLDIYNLTLSPGDKIEIVYMLRVGAGVKHGVNTVAMTAYNNMSYTLKISNTASVQVEITANDPMLDESLVIGTVFNDKNSNMIQDEDEEGLSGVKIVTVEGYIITTDQYGRFNLLHIKGGEWGQGRNFIMKIDPSSLPKGFKFTTANPLVRRIMPGIPVRFDFGVKFPNKTNNTTTSTKAEQRK
ncbi:MAG: DUF11 domain-containing protein [Endomicrobium sp.]|nr:DUF11 domain-containing protein [Endomicrobium sp.]